MQSDIKMEFYSADINLWLIDYVNGFALMDCVLFAYKKWLYETYSSLILVSISIMRFFAIFLIRSIRIEIKMAE